MREAPGSRPLSRRFAIHGVHGPAGVARYQMVSRLGAPSLPEPAANAPALPVEACGASAHHSDPIHGRRRGRRQGRVATCSRRRAVATVPAHFTALVRPVLQVRPVRAAV